MSHSARRMKLCIPVVLLLLATLRVYPQASQGTSAEKICASLTGQWTGSLEYRDFESNKRVQLPTWLDVTSSPGRNNLQFLCTYDDGPGKLVTDLSRVKIDFVNSTWTESGEDNHSKAVYKIAETGKVAATGYGALQLMGVGTENDKTVDVRITVTIGRNYFRYEKETRPTGGEFQFRDGYSFTRREPPSSGPSSH